MATILTNLVIWYSKADQLQDICNRRIVYFLQFLWPSSIFHCSRSVTLCSFPLPSLLSLSHSFSIRCILCCLYPFHFRFSLKSFLFVVQDSRDLPVYFVQVMTSDSFWKLLSVLALKVRTFLDWLINTNIVAARSIYKLTKRWKTPASNFRISWCLAKAPFRS